MSSSSSSPSAKAVAASSCSAFPNYTFGEFLNIGDETKQQVSSSSRPYVIGLTGGIASGKSSISKFLSSEFKIRTIDCDKIGHRVYLKGTPVFNQLVETFGQAVINQEDGEINRRALGGIVFSDPKKMQKLNELVWPFIAQEASKEIAENSPQTQAQTQDELTADSNNLLPEIVVMEAAVLFEAGWGGKSASDSIVDEAWAVLVTPEEAETRIMERNGLSSQEAQKRIKSQMTNAERAEQADVLLHTMGSYAESHELVRSTWSKLLERIKENVTSAAKL